MPPPTGEEQYLLELVNRARSDPAGEADRLAAAADPGIARALDFFDVDMALFVEDMRARASAPPLAWSPTLAAAARAHTELMIVFDMQAHVLPGEPGLAERVAAAGYDGFLRLAENVYAHAEDPFYAHAGFMIDWGYGPGGMQDPAGHRDALLDPAYAEVGMAIIAVVDPAADVGPIAVTQDFGARFDAPAALTGVAYDDADDDGFYDPGEGLGGVRVRARSAEAGAAAFETFTADAGGYALPLAPGRYVVEFEGAALAAPMTRVVEIASANIKIDVVAGASTEAPPADPPPADPVPEDPVPDDPAPAPVRRSGGPGAEALTGGAGGDVLKGLGGADALAGEGGADLLMGGDGDDALTGGAGDDTLKAGRGADLLDGGSGDDALLGFRGDETLIGGAGGDRLLGGLDDDVLIGGPGDDRMQGGPGRDRFVFSEPGWGRDRIALDFRPGSDSLDFRGSGLTFDDLTLSAIGGRVLVRAGDDAIVLDASRIGPLSIEMVLAASEDIFIF